MTLRREYQNTAKRILTLVLAVVMAFGAVPSAFAADPLSEIPSTITLKTKKYSGNSFTTSELGNARNRVLTANAGGTEVPMFCADHTKDLNTTPGAVTWGSPESIDTYQSGKYMVCKPFVDAYYYHYYNNQGIDEEYGNLPEGSGEDPASDPPKTKMDVAKLTYNEWYMGEWSRMLYSSYAQCAIWLAGFGKFTDLNDDAQLRMLAKNVQAAMHSMYPPFGTTDSEVEERYQAIKNILSQYETGYYASNGRIKGTWDFYIYTPQNGTNQQTMFLAKPKTVDEAYEGYIKLLKENTLGEKLQGARFEVFEDSACKTPADGDKSGTTDAQGELMLKVRWSGNDKRTFYVRESSAPEGYSRSTTVYAVVVDGHSNTSSNPALVSGGAPILNSTITTDQPSQTIIQKIEAVTGAGIGPATFTFYGPGSGGGQGTYDYTTNENGELEVQWSNPTKPFYLPPGVYTVREKVAPAGYELSDETQQLTLDEDGIHHTGPLVFRNKAFHTVILEKRDDSGNPLEGASFDIYKNGTKVSSGTTGPDGKIVYAGPIGKGVDTGVYAFYETQAPAGYLLPYERWHQVFVNVDDPESANNDDGIYTHVLTATNFKEPEIVLKKVNMLTGEGAAGACFEVLIDGTLLGRYGPTGRDGTIIIKGSDYRGHLSQSADSWTVTVKEVQAPDGYFLDDENVQTVEMKKGQELAPFIFRNMPYPEIVITKMDRETKARLSGCQMRIVIGSGFDVTRTTDDLGEIRISYAEYGRYLRDRLQDNQITVTELTPPQTYNRDGQVENANSYSITKTLIAGETKIDFEFTDTEYRDIRVYKRDAQTNWLLSGAEFHLESIQLDDSNGQVSRDGVTDDTGSILFKDVPNGTYQLTETKAPFGYAGNSEVRTIVVSSDDEPVIEVTYKNAPKSALLIRKIDAVTLQPIPNVKVKIERYSDDAVLKTWERFTDSNGVIVLDETEGLEIGWYKVTEMATVDGYILNTEPQTIYVANQHESYTVTLTNNQTHMLNVLKLDSKTGKPLPGATFMVSTAGGSHVANITTGINGYANLPEPQPGSYVVKEVKAPDGHLLDPYPQTFEITDSDAGRVFTLVFYDSPTIKLYLVKHSRQTNEPLEGAEYKVTKSDGRIIADKVVTDANGIAMVTNSDLGEGTYYITELKAPTGYLLDTEVHSVFINDGEVKTVDLYDDMPGGIKLLKVSAATDEPLEGAGFDLYSVDAKLLGSYETGADGYLRIDNLTPGFYFLRETKAPTGYQLDSEYRRVEVKAFEVTDVKWTNSERSSLTIEKLDKDTKLPLGAAEFEIRTLSGELVKTVVTSDAGVANVTNLEDGYYTVRETKAPQGYLLNTESQMVRIQANLPAKATFEDQAMKGVVVTKMDAVDKQPLAAARFEIRDLNNTLLGTYVTDGSGSFTTEVMEPGFYYLVETKAPDGYVLSSEPKLFEVKEGVAADITVENYRESTIQVFKADSVTGAPLSAAEFAVKDSDGNIVEIITSDNTGWAYTTRLLPGDYTVTETKAPSGYTVDGAEHKVHVEAGKSAIIRLTNAPDTSLRITKVDRLSRALLTGATFELSYDTGHGDCTYIGTYTTDPTGSISTEPLTPGFYIIKEIKAPDGYALDASFSSRSYGGLANVKLANNEYRYCLTAGVTNEVIVEDSELAVITIRKIDSVTNRPIAGATFKVETVDHSLVGMVESDANGEAILTGVVAGTYIITETIAPEGYSLSASPQTIVVEYGKNNYVDFRDAEKASLLIDLRDKITGVYLAGGKFTVMRCSDNTIIYESATDMAGSIVVGDLTPGKYIITQTFAPAGYYIIEAQQTIMVPAGTQQTVHFFNVTAGLVIEAVDSLTKATIEGVRFQITRNEDNIVIGEYATDKDGLALVSGLKPGMYTVEVLVTAENYTIDLERSIVHVKETGEAHVTFTFTPYAGLTVRVVDKDTQKAVSDCIVEIWVQNGELVRSYTTDMTGTFVTERMAPGFYVLKLISVKDGYNIILSEATVEIRNGVPVTYTFEVTANGSLTVISKDQNGKAIPGMKFSVTEIDGTIVGEYVTAEAGSYTISDLKSGYYVVTELEAPEGFDIVTVSQNANVSSNGNVEIVFGHTQTFGLQVRTICRQTGEFVPGASYVITKLDGAVIGTYTSDKAGFIYVVLTPGYYVVTPKDAPEGYTFTDPAPRNVEVKANGITTIDFELSRMSSIRVRVIDGATGNGIYGVRLMVKNGTACIKEFTTDNEGYIRLDETVLNGAYVLEMFSVPSGYRVDTIPKSISVLVAETTEVTWKLYKDAGQIQVLVTSSEYNASRDLPAGTPLQDAIFEITNADTYQVVGRMISDTSGIAASGGLPIGRYIVTQIGAAPYYGISEKQLEVRLKVNNDVVRVEVQNPSVNLKAEITQKSNKNIKAGSSMRVDITTAANRSDVRIDDFFLHIKVPSDAARISTISTGTWNQAVWYSIRYKTNMRDYELLSDKLLSTSKYQFDLSTASLGLQLGEYVTDVRYEFGTVPAGFHATTKPAYMLYVLSTVPNGYKLISRVEIGGRYNTIITTTNGNVGTAGPGSSEGTSFDGAQITGNTGLWTTNANTWTTNVSSNVPSGSLPSSLPKTGY